MLSNRADAAQTSSPLLADEGHEPARDGGELGRAFGVCTIDLRDCWCARPDRDTRRPRSSSCSRSAGGSRRAAAATAIAAVRRALRHTRACRRRRARGRARRSRLARASRARAPQAPESARSSAPPRRARRAPQPGSPSRCRRRAPSRRRAARAPRRCGRPCTAARSSDLRRSAARRRHRPRRRRSGGTKRSRGTRRHRREHALVVDAARAQLPLDHRQPVSATSATPKCESTAGVTSVMLLDRRLDADGEQRHDRVALDERAVAAAAGVVAPAEIGELPARRRRDEQLAGVRVREREPAAPSASGWSRTVGIAGRLPAVGARAEAKLLAARAARRPRRPRDGASTSTDATPSNAPGEHLGVDPGVGQEVDLAGPVGAERRRCCRRTRRAAPRGAPPASTGVCPWSEWRITA